MIELMMQMRTDVLWCMSGLKSLEDIYKQKRDIEHVHNQQKLAELDVYLLQHKKDEE